MNSQETPIVSNEKVEEAAKVLFERTHEDSDIEEDWDEITGHYRAIVFSDVRAVLETAGVSVEEWNHDVD